MCQSKLAHNAQATNISRIANDNDSSVTVGLKLLKQEFFELLVEGRRVAQAVGRRPFTSELRVLLGELLLYCVSTILPTLHN
jgi:hypothetical protein